jgi:arylsulfatase A-like enzyme/predicted negative regulator of RcsB-dependent stress response
MKRNRFVLSVVAVISLAVLILVIQSVRQRAGRVNILLITLDTTRADRLGCYGYRDALTPALDKLAARGVLFENAYTPIPITLPAHTSILTGLYPPEHGLHTNGKNSLGAGVPTLAKILAAEGYDTAAFLAAFVLDSKFGLDRGFQIYNDDLTGAAPNPDKSHRYRPAELMVGSAMTWLKHRDEKPFFCWVHLFDPHLPYHEHSATFGNRFAGKPYDAEIAYVDQQIERLVDFLESQDLKDQTLIVVAGDHGESLGEHDEQYHSMMVYNSTMRIPLIANHPKLCSPNRRVSTPVSLVDIFPTILDCVGVDSPQPVSGRSLKGSLQGQSLEPVPLYGETEEPFFEAGWSPLQSVTTEQWKFIRTTRVELYDLKNDPAEEHNLATEKHDQVQELKETLAEMESRMRLRTAGDVQLTAKEKRVLASLGYTAGNSPAKAGHPQKELRDIKDMIGHFNKLGDAKVLIAQRNYKAAVPILEEMLKDDEDYFKARASLGICYARLGRLDEAVTNFERTLELAPDSDRVHAALGATLMMQKKFDRAITSLSTSLKINPNSALVHYNMGESLRQIGKTDEARTQYLESLKLNPNFAPARKALSSLPKQ